MKSTSAGSTSDSRIAWFVESSEMDGVSRIMREISWIEESPPEPDIEGLEEVCSGDPSMDSTDE